ncbi:MULTISPECIES: NAD(P)/FAD-dependent oxidoreductase [unclassified Cryobacterium]|uniref:NAD(P)/FAD-dependent oxidoreductase n=1 Tax=unclassified Cryobacterium TaxID=2649013 RepID=UPI001444CCE0|nr:MULTISPECIES: FAD-dependent oxidoreductase [unclassified Cryobacterium]
MDDQEFVIIGGGLAGASAAEELREKGFAGKVTIVAAETHVPYIRPPLSKGYLAGSEGLDAAYVHPADWYGEHDIDLMQGRSAQKLDLAEKRVLLDDGSLLPYDKLLLATGASPRRLPIDGGQLDGVHYLRTIEDSQSLHEALGDGGRRLVLIGSGWIGMEVGASARTLGNEVTILERDPIPLANAIGDELGSMFAEFHREKGVVLRPSVVVKRIVGDGRVSGVELEDGEVVPADLVLIGVGAIPNTTLAEAAGLVIDNGVATDAALRTSDPNVFAAGDVANAFHPRVEQRLRNEHWANALNQGPAAARSMLGEPTVFDEIPYFYTDQFDLGMEYSGFGSLTKDATIVYRGDRESREFIAFWVADGKVVAGMNVNVWDVNDQVQRLIRSQRVVDLDALADESVPLDALAQDSVPVEER